MEIDKRNYNEINELLKIASFAGRLILENGGETYRSEDTIVRMLENKVENVETYVTPTGIFVSIEQDGKTYTKISRITRRGTDLNKIALVNDLSRRFSKEEWDTLDINIYLRELKSINSKGKYNDFLKILAAGVAGASAMMILGGSNADFIPTFITAMLLQVFVMFLERIGFPTFIVNCVGGGFVTIFSMLFSHFGMGSSDMIIIGSIMILVPGVAITNSLRDIIWGDLVSGISRGVDAFIAAIGIATGVGVVLKIWNMIGGII